MRRTTFQLVVVVLTGVAFVATAVSGLVLFAPAKLLPVFSGSLGQWRTIHEWGAAALVATVVAHVVLHRRRFGRLLVMLCRPRPTARRAAPPATVAAALAPPPPTVKPPPAAVRRPPTVKPPPPTARRPTSWAASAPCG